MMRHLPLLRLQMQRPDRTWRRGVRGSSRRRQAQDEPQERFLSEELEVLAAVLFALGSGKAGIGVADRQGLLLDSDHDVFVVGLFGGAEDEAFGLVGVGHDECEGCLFFV